MHPVEDNLLLESEMSESVNVGATTKGLDETNEGMVISPQAAVVCRVHIERLPAVCFCAPDALAP